MPPPAPWSAVRRALAALATALAGGCAAAGPPDADGLVSAPGGTSGAGLEVIVLGVAQDGGLPQLGCNRPCCESARREGRHLEPACLGVIDHGTGRLLLVEATPAIEPQVARLQAAAGAHDRGRQPVDAMLVTHAHLGHYLGLAFLGREAAAAAALPVYAAERLQEFLRANGPWSQLVALRQIELRALPLRTEFAPFADSDLRVRAVPVPHRGEFSETTAFVLRGPHRAVLFVPDVDRWDAQPGLLAELMSGTAIAYVDGTFFDGSELPDRDLAEIRHPFMTDTMAALADVARVRPGSVRFLHLNHTNPALRDAAVVAGLQARGFAIARQGERIGL